MFWNPHGGQEGTETCYMYEAYVCRGAHVYPRDASQTPCAMPCMPWRAATQLQGIRCKPASGAEVSRRSRPGVRPMAASHGRRIRGRPERPIGSAAQGNRIYRRPEDRTCRWALGDAMDAWPASPQGPLGPPFPHVVGRRPSGHCWGPLGIVLR